MKPAPRADFGAPVDAFFARQSPALEPVLTALRKLIMEAAPTAKGEIKWGNPFYSVDGGMYVAVSAHKVHVNLILPGPPGTYKDPKGLLEGEGKTGKHLKLTGLSDLPVAQVKAWLKIAAKRARDGQKMR